MSVRFLIIGGRGANVPDAQRALESVLEGWCSNSRRRLSPGLCRRGGSRNVPGRYTPHQGTAAHHRYCAETSIVRGTRTPLQVGA